MTAEVRISPDDADMLRQQMLAKGRCEFSGTIKFYQENQVVAEAYHTIGIYSDIPRSVGVKMNVLQNQNITTSALMIAGLREDPVSAQIAGDQGRAVASRMSLAAPQLPSLVRARTIDVERHLEHEGHKFRQVLCLGVGFDPKPIRFSSASQTWFGLDFKGMLKERTERFSQLNGAGSAANFIPVAGNLLIDDWEASLLSAGLDPSQPTLVIAEGLSMYFTQEDLAGIFRKVSSVVQNPYSRFWIDHVTPTLFELEMEEVRSFLSTMARLGEPFITGFDDPTSIKPDLWTLSETKSASAIVGVSDGIHEEYRFSVLKPLGPINAD